MATKYTKDETWKAYSHLSPDLKEAMFSPDTADHIFAICERNGVNEVSRVAEYVGLVFLGFVPPDKIGEALLEEKIVSDKQAADDVVREINRLIFFPLRQELASLNSLTTQPNQDLPFQGKPAGRPLKTTAPSAKKPVAKTPSADDPYRESVDENS